MSSPDAEEAERIQTLRDYQILDTPHEACFDNLTRMVASSLEVPICLVTLIDTERAWFKSHYGFPHREADRSAAFCSHVVRTKTPLVIQNTSADPRFRESPLVTSAPHFRFYAGVPIRASNGHALGTLCTLDMVEREPSSKFMSQLEAFAKQVELELELGRRLADLQMSQVALQQRQSEQELFASMIVHDLRNPAAGLMMTLEQAFAVSDGPVRELIAEAQDMAGLFQRQLVDVLDLCLAGAGGLRVRRSEFSLEQLTRTTLQKMRCQADDLGVQVNFTAVGGATELSADEDLVRRVILNIVDNSLQCSRPGSRLDVTVDATNSGRVRLIVEDEGPGVREDALEAMFEPFKSEATSYRGRGIGLALCKLAAKVHGGTIVAANRPNKGLRVTFALPSAGANSFATLAE